MPVAFVTGAASGIGKTIARQFGLNQYAVAITDRDVSKGCEAVEELASEGITAAFFPLDVRCEKNWQEVAGRARILGKISVLVNNAGYLNRRLLTEFTPADFFSMFETNTLGVALGMKTMHRYLKEGSSGSIVNIGSTSSLVGYGDGYGMYSASKAAVIMLSKCAAIEFAPDGIRVNTICPSAVRTPMSEAALTTEEWKSRLNTTLLGRFASPDDVALSALFLASENAGYITGQTLIIDGGATSTFNRNV